MTGLYDVEYQSLPEHMRRGAEDYVERGVEPGAFLRAVLENDLVGAYGHADLINLAALHVWCRWLWNEAPSNCWGSRADVDAWIARHEGIAAVPA